ncbi:MAG: hypothetical protein LBM93_02495 [Oscillospiraceae bacterium]|nr:hypothetical protein [Oscillospiraceae bacterium]
MKKIALIIVMIILVCAALVVGFKLGGKDSESEEKLTATALSDFSGTWKQSNVGSSDMWQEAVIGDEEIEIFWISDGGDSKSLYWAGSFENPETEVSEYSWESINNTEKTDSALLASSAESKEFTYKNGYLQYEATAMGVTKTVKLEKVN